MTLIQIVIAAVSLVAACGGSGKETAMEIEAAESKEVAGHAAAVPYNPRWIGIQFCEGSAAGEPLKSSEETELGAYKKSATKVVFSGLSVGPSKEYSCPSIQLEGLVMMGDKSGAFFEGNDLVECSSPTGRLISAKLGLGHDTDLRYIDPTESPALSFEVALIETATKEESDLGVSARSKARFNCSFDLELR